jgi:hypothetical protein
MAGLFASAQSAPVPAEKSAASPLTSPGRFTAWNDGLIDRLEIKERFQLADYAGVRVLPIEAAESALPLKDDSTYKDAVEMMGLAQRYLIYGMKKKLKSLPVTAAPPPPAPATASAPVPAPAPAPASTPEPVPVPASVPAPASTPEATPAAPPFLLLRVRAVKVRPGSLVPNAVGGIIGAMMSLYDKSSVTLEGELLDGASGRELLNFYLTRSSKDSDSRLSMMVNNTTDAGSDLGKMLTFFAPGELKRK